jgi:hypothetical protein
MHIRNVKRARNAIPRVNVLYSELLTAGIALVAGVIGGILTQIKLRRPAKQQNGVLEIRNRRFVLVNEADRQRALLRVINDDATLLLSDPEMRWRVRVGVGKEGPYIYLSQEEINTRMGLGITPEGAAGLELLARDGTPRVVLGLAADGEGSLVFNDARKGVRAKLAVSAGGYVSFTLFDEAGNELTHLPAADR